MELRSRRPFPAMASVRSYPTLPVRDPSMAKLGETPVTLSEDSTNVHLFDLDSPSVHLFFSGRKFYESPLSDESYILRYVLIVQHDRNGWTLEIAVSAEILRSESRARASRRQVAMVSP